MIFSPVSNFGDQSLVTIFKDIIMICSQHLVTCTCLTPNNTAWHRNLYEFDAFGSKFSLWQKNAEMLVLVLVLLPFKALFLYEDNFTHINFNFICLENMYYYVWNKVQSKSIKKCKCIIAATNKRKSKLKMEHIICFYCEVLLQIHHKFSCIIAELQT